MGLDEQIQRLSNPQEFAKLCHLVFAVKHGSEYQAVDGSRADGGNDGYIKSEACLLQFYCPSKPVRPADAEYRKKIREDLAKAAALRDGGMPIRKWTFVTPHNLSNGVLQFLAGEAAKHHLESAHVGPAFLAKELWFSPKLLNELPSLQVIDLDERLREITAILRRLDPADVQSGQTGGAYVSETPPSREDPELEQVRKLLTQPATDQMRSDLRAAFYAGTSAYARLNALLGVVQYADAIKDDPTDLMDFCDLGIRLAESLDAAPAKAVFLAHKGLLFTRLFASEDTHSAVMVQMENATGVRLTSDVERQAVMVRLHQLDDASREAFQEALGLAKSPRAMRAAADVVLMCAQAAGLRFIHLDKFGAKERAAREKVCSKLGYEVAKDIYIALGDELGFGYTLYNLAHSLRLFGETAEAKPLVEKASGIAKKYGDARLLRDAETLLRRIVTGRIPDYVHGEGRDSV